jgi:hypothetical protein
LKVLNDEYVRSIDSYFLKKIAHLTVSERTESESETESEITTAPVRSLQTKYHVTKILTNRNREQMLNKARI